MMQNLINNPARSIILATSFLSIAACAPESGPGQFYREAGAQIDQGEFGNATMHNQLVQSCRTNGAGGGGKAGAVAGDPLVVLDPKSTPSRPVYRVHCSGQLDGKYAQVVYRDYVASATPPTTVNEADVEGE